MAHERIKSMTLTLLARRLIDQLRYKIINVVIYNTKFFNVYLINV